ncbi:GntR family transcriptional regulator, histidine utilization repressor [Xaviernesmea oryzae]|uniref:Histidine utilization repressor n=1 Tax=Xaviernesmea oryzae TaxID=464029 RepID=A0A1X7EWS7_9HYPH|nr:histidine utilization repressor [Xaviernesmea oryzae]SMF41518.1 GntR family transcriptional regulator, histidine utilization repressor [Xaviernesmea oryzae]
MSQDSTLHRKILSDIEGRIVSGEWPPGFRLPFEVDLARQYGCSRMTVNKVMTQLVQAGLIERRKRSGSFVTQPKAQSAVLEIHDIREEVQSLNLAYGYALISRAQRDADAEDRRRLGLTSAPSSPARIVDVTCLHSAGGQPFCLEERLINLETVPEAGEFEFETLAPGPWLLAQIPWTAAEHRIQAVSAGKKEAKFLKLSAGHACLVIERQTWSYAGPVTNVRLTYPGNRHMVTAQFKPGGN